MLAFFFFALPAYLTFSILLTTRQKIKMCFCLATMTYHYYLKTFTTVVAGQLGEELGETSTWMGEAFLILGEREFSNRSAQCR